jgi:FkbM family methyltransferase
MTTSCRDCDVIPKKPDAGAVVIENGQRVQIMHNGLRVMADEYYGAWMTEIICRLHGHHEPQEELVFNAILEQLPEQASMIEVGGFWSYYSLWFLQEHTARRAIVIESDPNYLETGRRNAALNRAKVDFVLAFVGPADRRSVAFGTESAGVIQLPMINLASFIDRHGIDPLDILHCDAQGAEIEVIRSCEQHLRNGRIRFLVLSTHSDAITGDPLTHQRCLDEIQTLGGQMLAEHDVHESFSGDGLIAAHFGAELIAWPKLAMSYNRYSSSLFRSPAYDLSLARVEVARLKEELAKQRMK